MACCASCATGGSCASGVKLGSTKMAFPGRNRRVFVKPGIHRGGLGEFSSSGDEDSCAGGVCEKETTYGTSLDDMWDNFLKINYGDDWQSHKKYVEVLPPAVKTLPPAVKSAAGSTFDSSSPSPSRSCSGGSCGSSSYVTSGFSGSSSDAKSSGSSFWDLFSLDYKPGTFMKAFEAGFGGPGLVSSSISTPSVPRPSISLMSMSSLNLPTIGNGGKLRASSISSDAFDIPAADLGSRSSWGGSGGRSSGGLIKVAMLAAGGVLLWKFIKRRGATAGK